MPVFAVLAFGSVGQGVYEGFQAAPLVITVIGAMEFLALAGVLMWHANDITTSWAPYGQPQHDAPGK